LINKISKGLFVGAVRIVLHFCEDYLAMGCRDGKRIIGIVPALQVEKSRVGFLTDFFFDEPGIVHQGGKKKAEFCFKRILAEIAPRGGI